MKELLNAFSAEQSILQFFKIPSVIVKIINHGYTRQLICDLAHPRVHFSHLLPVGGSLIYYPLAANQTPASQLVTLTLVSAFAVRRSALNDASGESAVNHTLADMRVSWALGLDRSRSHDRNQAQPGSTGRQPPEPSAGPGIQDQLRRVNIGNRVTLDTDKRTPHCLLEQG